MLLAAASCLTAAFAAPYLLEDNGSIHADDGVDVESLAGLLELLIDVDADSAQKSIAVISAKIQQHEVDAGVRDRKSTRLNSSH